MSRFNIGGTSQWIYQLSQGLDKRGISNTLLIGDCPKQEREDSRLLELDYKRIPGLGPKTSPLQTFRAFLALRKEIKLSNPDIVNTHTSKAGVLGRLAAISTKTNSKIVHTYHGHVLDGYFNSTLENLIRWIEIFVSSFTDLFFVSGEKVLLDLKDAGIIGNKPSVTVWPAVPEILVGDRSELRRSLSIPDEAVVFGWLGRKVPIKRIDRILDLAKARPEYRFIIAGDGESIRETYSEFFLNDGLPNVLELGFTSPSAIWAISDVCLLTSDNEAMPISPIEAALCGRPSIVTDVGSSREVLMNSETGFVSSKKTSEMLSFIDQLAGSKILRKKMGQAAYNFARSRFSPQSSIDRQIAGYKLALRN